MILLKYILLLFSFCLVAAGCQQHRKFFDYDEVIHYYHPGDGSEPISSPDNGKSGLDTLRSGVIEGGIPRDITDTAFIARLKEMGYSPRPLKQSAFPEIDALFSEKDASDASVTSCIRIYRDVLIFRKHNKVTGIAKICFECGDYNFNGTQTSTESFGSPNDYERLYHLLHGKGQ
ncbi:hypothetical protein [Taibaiella koreensis]|uniref:hypothetical protein n=1 Tax=Taibaiella koreensis TaxID=1268548 RepID=UPI000E5A05B9|nr:hypothetical protein [Taibaiella koreensis]